MNKWLKWVVVLLALGALGLGVMRALKTRGAQQQALAEATAVQKAQNVVELASTDVMRVTSQTLTQGVPLTGTVKAVNSAFVKARVAGELQGLMLREGDVVRTGQVIARIEAVEYEARVNQAQRQAEAARAQIDIAQRQYDNNKALVDQGFISRTALDTSLATLQSAEASHRAALAAVDLARKSLEDTVLRAPLTGIVSQRLAQSGERLAIDARVVEVVDLSQLELEASIATADALAVRIGQMARIRIEGAQASGNARSEWSARVVRINPATQAGSRSLLVYLGIEQPGGLRQGLFAEGRISTGALTGLVLPLSAVRTDRPAPYVQLVADGQIAHRPVTSVQQGEIAGSPEVMTLVQGLSEGDVVVAGSVGNLTSGTRVRMTAQK